MSTEPDDIEHDVLLSERRDTWRRRLARSGTVLLVLGLLGAGATFGWYLRGWVPGGGVGVTTTKVVVNRPVRVDGQAVAPGTLPNVLGLDEDEARQAYQDAGVEPSDLDVVQVPFVGRVGSVVEQDPPGASKVPKPGTRLRLLLARAATMPDLRGLSADAARGELDAIGVGAATQVRYEPSVQPGEVARTEPAAGAPAVPQATLFVSEEGSSVDLAALEPVASDCSIGDATVRGATVADAVLCDAFSTPARADYAINARVIGLDGKLALADGHASGARARLVVSRNGRVVASYTTTGPPVEVKARFPGGKSLTLEIRSDDDEGVTAVLSGARVIGARSGIDRLTQ